MFKIKNLNIAKIIKFISTSKKEKINFIGLLTECEIENNINEIIDKEFSEFMSFHIKNVSKIEIQEIRTKDASKSRFYIAAKPNDFEEFPTNHKDIKTKILPFDNYFDDDFNFFIACNENKEKEVISFFREQMETFTNSYIELYKKMERNIQKDRVSQFQLSTIYVMLLHELIKEGKSIFSLNSSIEDDLFRSQLIQNKIKELTGFQLPKAFRYTLAPESQGSHVLLHIFDANKANQDFSKDFEERCVIEKWNTGEEFYKEVLGVGSLSSFHHDEFIKTIEKYKKLKNINLQYNYFNKIKIKNKDTLTLNIAIDYSKTFFDYMSSDKFIDYLLETIDI